MPVTIDTEKSRAAEVAAHVRLDDPEFREKTEYDVYRLLQQHLPAVKVKGEVSHDRDPWLFTRFEDCKFIQQHPEVFSNDIYRHMQVKYVPQQIDPPEQREYRKILEPLFSPQEMEPLEPDIEKFAHELLDPMVAAGSFDFMPAFSVPFPTIIFCRLMGFPLVDHTQLMRWSHILLHGHSTVIAKHEGLAHGEKPDPKVAEALVAETRQKVIDYIAGLLDERRKAPTGDLMSRLLAARYNDERPLDQQELMNICYLFFLGGLDTVTGVLGMCIKSLAERPADRERFIATLNDPQKLTMAIEELLRFNATVNPPRRVKGNCTLAGVELQNDDLIVTAVAGANRDPEIFANPDDLVFDRQPNPHLTFSVGVHRCLGIHLARRELRIGLKAIHERMPNYRITPGQEPKLFTSGLRGLYSLPLDII